MYAHVSVDAGSNDCHPRDLLIQETDRQEKTQLPEIGRGGVQEEAVIHADVAIRVTSDQESMSSCRGLRERWERA